MSNFSALALIDGTLNGSAPCRFLGSSPDSLSTIMAAGYLNDINKKVKANDRFDINYLDTSTFPLNIGESSVFGSFMVQYDPILGNWNLIPNSFPTSIISSYNVHSAVYENAGGSATTTFNDSSITPNHVVLARWQSSANAVIIKTVSPGNGTLTVVSSADPGASVLEYISYLPSVALQGLGVYAAIYSNAGGSATITIVNPNITSNMIVNANFVSQANAAEIKKVTANNGSIVIVATTDPGVSVISYSAITPSSALSSDGLYAANYSNAGGSATTTISDANINANSIVVADWSTQANAVEIEKVTASAGTLTIISSGDPGVSILNYVATPSAQGGSGEFLLSSNNLSDVNSPSTAVSNLGFTKSAAAISNAVVQLGTLQSVSVTLNPTQMAAAYATPAQLIANPLASQMILVLSAEVYTASTGNTPYATGTAPIIQYSSGGTNGAHGTGTIATATGLAAGDITAATSQVRNLLQFATGAQTGLSGLGIYFSNATGGYTAGTGTNVTFTLNYITLTATV